MKTIVNSSPRSLAEALYQEKMVQRLKETNPKRPPTTEQAPSTMRTLLRDPKEDDQWLSRPLPELWKAKPNAKTIDEAVGTRPVTPDEIQLVEATRRRPKNSVGQSELKGVSEIQVDRAIQAVLYTPPAKVTKEEIQARAVNLTEFKSELKEVWIELPWYKALFHWIRGNKVKQESKK